MGIVKQTEAIAKTDELNKEFVLDAERKARQETKQETRQYNRRVREAERKQKEDERKQKEMENKAKEKEKEMDHRQNIDEIGVQVAGKDELLHSTEQLMQTAGFFLTTVVG